MISESGILMAISNDLRAKLKASDKRRRRRHRLPTDQFPPEQAATAEIDVTGLIVAALLESASGHRGFADSAAIAALRGCSTGNAPSKPHSRAAFSNIQAIASRDQVSTRAFHRAIKSLLEIASKHQGTGSHPECFLDYLTLLSS